LIPFNQIATKMPNRMAFRIPACRQAGLISDLAFIDYAIQKIVFVFLRM
jgi:hypothetical protein